MICSSPAKLRLFYIHLFPSFMLVSCKSNNQTKNVTVSS